MLLAAAAIIGGVLVLVWSADLFVEGAAGTARYFGMPPLLIGMVVVGFGTSAPELVVSTLSSWQGNPNLALGNAYGSNICNIALILGVTALISPIVVHSSVLRKELPILLGATGLTAGLLLDRELSRPDARCPPAGRADSSPPGCCCSFSAPARCSGARWRSPDPSA